MKIYLNKLTQDLLSMAYKLNITMDEVMNEIKEVKGYEEPLASELEEDFYCLSQLDEKLKAMIRLIDKRLKEIG